MKRISPILGLIATLALLIVVACSADSALNTTKTNEPLQSVQAAKETAAKPAPAPAVATPTFMDIVRITAGFVRQNPGVVELDYLAAKVNQLWQIEQQQAQRIKSP